MHVLLENVSPKLLQGMSCYGCLGVLPLKAQLRRLHGHNSLATVTQTDLERQRRLQQITVERHPFQLRTLCRQWERL